MRTLLDEVVHARILLPTALFLLIWCDLQGGKGGAPEIEPDTPAIVSDATLSEQMDFSDVFVEGRSVSSGGIPGKLEIKRIGTLSVQSGKIVSCDVFVFFDSQPFTRVVPTGNFEVLLSVVSFADDERVGFAKIVFSDQKTVRWEEAVVERPASTSSNRLAGVGYPVDSGTGSFMDSMTAVMVLSRMEQEESNGSEGLSKRLLAELDKNRRVGWGWANYEYADGLSVVLFTSGWGDGRYRSYFGLDAHDQVTELITDFGIITP